MTVTVKEGAHAKVTVEKTNIGESVDEFEIPLSTQVLMGEDMAQVSVGLGYTKNLGNYESLKIHVHVTSPCSNETKSIQTTADWITKFCDDTIEKILKTDDD